MSKGGDNREQRAKIREAERDGRSAGDAGLSTGADKQIGHHQQLTDEELHEAQGNT
jgi:hypothetical protein